MQGLTAAQPTVTNQVDSTQGQEALTQVATQVLHELASKFGPDILTVIQQLLSTPTAGLDTGSPVSAQAGAI